MKSGDSTEPSGFAAGLFQLHPTLDALSTFIYVKDRDLHIVSANRAFCDALGVTREELLGSQTMRYLGASGSDSERIDREVLSSGVPRLGVVESYPAPDGLHWVVTDKAPIRGPDGTVVGLVGTSIDITAQKESDERLRQSESEIRFLTEHMADILWTMDLQFHTTFVTPSITRVLGFTPEERRRQSLQEMVTPDSAGRILAQLQRQLQFEVSGSAERDRTLTIDVEYYRKDGSTVWMETLIQAVRDDAGPLAGMAGVSRDITERKRAEQALKESEEKYRALFELSKDAAYLVAPDGHFIEVNQSWINLFGYSRDEASRMHVEAIYEDPVVRTESFLPRISQEGEVVDWEVRFKKRDGTIMDCLCSVVARRDQSGDVICLQGIVHDITERKRAQQALKESEEKYRTLFEQSVDAINLVGIDGRIIHANPAWFSLFGYTPDDVGSYNAADVYVEPEGRARFLQAISLKDAVEDETQFRRRDGTVFDCHRVVTVRRDSDGSIVGYQTVFHDVTETRKAERALRESEERYRTLMTNLNDVVYEVDADGRFTFVGPRTLDVTGYTPADILGRPFSDFVHPEDLPRVANHWQGVTGGAVDPVEFRMLKPGGEPHYVRISGRAVMRNGRFEGSTGIMTDINHEVEARNALHASEEKFRALFEQSIAPISLITPDGRLIEANDAWFRLLGYSREDMPSFNAADLFPSPEMRDEFVQRLLRCGSLTNDESRVKTRDGTFLDVVRSISVRYNPDGTVLGFQTVLRDVTREKAAERALLESEERFRMVLSRSPVIMAHVDRDLRYVWIHNPHPDFDQESVRGKRDDELADNEGTRQLMELKRQVIETGRPARETVSFLVAGGERTYDIAAEPLSDDEGTVVGATTVAFDISERKRAEQALRESEEKYRQLFDQSIAPISLLAPDGHLIDANDAWFQLFGYLREDASSINAVNLYPTPELREESVRRLLNSGTLIDDEARVKTKDGTMIDVLRSMAVRHNPDGSVLGYQTIWRDVTELHRMQDELLASREQLRRLALRIQDAREDERTAIARELHDHFGQELTALRLDLESLTSGPPPAGDGGLVRIRGILQLVDRMSQEVRRVISEMRPGMLDDLGLCAALEWQAGQFSERTGIACNLILTADDTHLPPSVNTALFRTFQELLTNVARHAAANYVDVSLISDSDCVYLAVVDDGRGITDEELHDSASLGILGIQERIRACGGNVTFQSEPGKGTTVTVTVPLQTCADDGWQTRLGLR